MRISREEAREWAEHPVTQAFKEILRESVQEAKDTWARRGYVGESLEQTALMNATALGGVEALQQAFDQIEAMGVPDVTN